jgi:ribonuclease HI
MELTAAIRALESLPDNDQSITVYTDSQYVSKGITEWIHGWRENNWKTAAKKSVENQDLWQVLWHNVQGKHIEWKFVRGHDGNEANERCDVIATSFADNESVDLYDGTRTKYSHSLAH